MQAKKCDRCQDFYTKNTEFKLQINFWPMGQYDFETKWFDLCPDCTEKFLSWVKCKSND